MPRILWVVFIIVWVGIAYVAYNYFFSSQPGGQGAAGGPMPVSVAEVVAKDIRQWRQFTGRLSAVESAEIRPRVSGVIQQLHFAEGQMVEAGQPLFTIDPRSYAATLKAAEAAAALAEAEFARARTLIADKAIPKREFDQRKNEVEIARAALTRAKLDMEYTEVRSPIRGRVSRPELTVGNLVDSGGNAPVLTSVVSIAPIYADVEIDEQTFVRYLQPALASQEKTSAIPVELVLSTGDKTYTGRVQSFDNQLNIASGTIRVRTVFDNEDGSLLPGLFARVRIADAVSQPSILVSERAIGTDQNRKFVIVVKEDGTTEQRAVTLGGVAEGLRIITEGLSAGEKIVVNGTQRIFFPGAPVVPELVDMMAIDQPKASPGSESPIPSPEAQP
ncbi:MAG: efflux RND transporter periplasmic adaptor subunit [Rickettsiales bacterium]|jgi:multidrug efflux system membrane fusion protein|nr:efflux RND transporter periplasmic adaptor subunit [Rickettsiales bacterium]